MINDGAEESHIKSHYLILLVCQKENKLINKQIKTKKITKWCWGTQQLSAVNCPIPTVDYQEPLALLCICTMKFQNLLQETVDSQLPKKDS